MSLKQIKLKIGGVNKTHTVTRAMEAVSAVKMRNSQERALSGRPYAIAALNILRRVGTSLDARKHPLTRLREERKVCILLITSDRGLAGALNSAVLKRLEEEIRARSLSKESCSFICLGRKGYEYVSKRGYSVLFHEANVSDAALHEDLESISARLAEAFTRGTCDRCLVIFTSFVSTFEQRPRVRTLLPLTASELSGIVEDIAPVRGKYAQAHVLEEPELYTLEPEPEALLDELLPFLLRIGVYHTLLEAKASEHSARMVAMKNASDKARDLSKELTRSYNKARQSLITREVSEIVGGIEAMR